MSEYLDLLPVITILLVSHSLCSLFLTVIVAKFYKVVYEEIT